LAIEVLDQCVAFGGVCSNVAITTSSTWSSRIEGGRPGRGSSTRPARRCSTNRRRQRATVLGVTRRSAATCLFESPAAQASTILDRNANTCEVFARRDQRVNCSRSSSVNTSSAFGRPIRSTSHNPSSRDSANRLRHLPTVIAVTPRSAANRSYTTPGSAQASTIRARTANRDELIRDHTTSWSRSSSVSTNSTSPRPEPDTPTP